MRLPWFIGLLIAVLVGSYPAVVAQDGPSPSVEGFDVGLETTAEGFEQPVFVTNAGDERLFVVERPGRIRVIDDKGVIEEPFLDLTDRVGSSSSEQGLLGLAFAPDFAESGLFYVDYTDLDGNTVVSRFKASDDRTSADAGSEEIVLTQEQPAPNHNGGMLAFGPDNYLYIGFGDGGNQGDPDGNAQNLESWLGKVLRIEVDPAQTNGEPYTVPEDNPFVDDPAAKPEIWAYGLRNPWRFSFDPDTGDLWIGDVGQGEYEEIDIVAVDGGGANLGWDLMEGPECYDAPDCEAEGLVDPVAFYTHEEGGCSVTGGYVSRSEEFAAIAGLYIFADFCSGLIWALAPDGDGGWTMSEPVESDLSISSFGEGADGRLYLTDLDGGVYELVPPL